jgi:plastocyanin
MKLSMLCVPVARRFAVAVLCLFAFAPQARAAELVVKIDNFVFVPANLTVKAGDTVKWVNVDDIPHTVVSQPIGTFRSKPLDTEQEFSFTFAKPGNFDYFCSLHPHMKGHIVVEP